MHIVNELSRALSQIDCDTVFTCGTLHDACVRDERKNEMLAAQYATRPEELASTLKSQIGFTISQDIVDMILKEALNSEREEDEEKMEEDEEKMEEDVMKKMEEDGEDGCRGKRCTRREQDGCRGEYCTRREQDGCCSTGRKD